MIKPFSFAMATLVIALSSSQAKDKNPIRVLLWSEQTEPRDVYPQGISGALSDHFKTVKSIDARMATITDPDTGVSDATLDQTDVVIWFVGSSSQAPYRAGAGGFHNSENRDLYRTLRSAGA